MPNLCCKIKFLFWNEPKMSKHFKMRSCMCVGTGHDFTFDLQKHEQKQQGHLFDRLCRVVLACGAELYCLHAYE